MGSIVGFGLNKINIERKKEGKGKLSIANNISVKEVTETKFAIGGSSQTGLKFNFIFESKYEPETAEMIIEGSLVYMTEEADAKKILATWKKDKKIEQALLEAILNFVLDKCNLEALMLARDLNLPPPFPLPKIKHK
jgi:hypothetical protein